MVNTKDAAANEKSRQKAEVAAIVEGLTSLLQGEEQLLGFTRGRLAGGLKGKLTIGPEAFFAPFVNVGLTERRVILQHIHPENGRPSEILPHSFPIPDVANITFSDIETFGSESAGRLVVTLPNEQSFRVRFAKNAHTDSARALVEVYRSLMRSRRSAGSMSTTCAICGHVLDEPAKFCPYCGSRLAPVERATDDVAPDSEPTIERVTIHVTNVVEDEQAPRIVVDEPVIEAEAEPLAEDIHRFTDEGGAPAAVLNDDAVTPEDDLPQPPPGEPHSPEPAEDQVWPPRHSEGD